MSGRVVFFLSSGGYEPAWQAASLALTAAAMGDEVVVVLGFGALRAAAAGKLGAPLSAEDAASQERAAAINAASPEKMLAEARALGAKVLACDTTARLCGLDGEALEREKRVDEVLGLASIWRLTQGARTLGF